MNNATFLSVQLNADDFSGSSGLVELLNRHLLFATDVAEAADALVQLASVAHMTGARATASSCRSSRSSGCAMRSTR